MPSVEIEWAGSSLTPALDHPMPPRRNLPHHRPHEATLESLLAGAMLLPRSEQLELLAELKAMIGDP